MFTGRSSNSNVSKRLGFVYSLDHLSILSHIPRSEWLIVCGIPRKAISNRIFESIKEE